MPKKKIIAQTAKKLNAANGLRKHGKNLRRLALAQVGVGAFVLKPRSFAIALVGGFVGASIGSQAKIMGESVESYILTRCVGKPRLSRELSKKVKSRPVKEILILLGRLKLNESQADAFRQVLIGKPTIVQKNVVIRIIEKELKNSPDVLKRLETYGIYH
jgi:hypothetical protein